MTLTVYTLGHSTHSTEDFIALLKRNAVDAVADVRSHPYSRFNPQFNRETLKSDLKEQGIAYVFLGRELGARSDDPDCYVSGKVQYDRLAQKPEFRKGLERVKSGAERMHIALMCAEKDPLDCHRTILVSRHLAEQGIEIRHILASGEVESHADALKRLKTRLRIPDQDLFMSRGELEADAYRKQEERIAYHESADDGNEEPVRRAVS